MQLVKKLIKWILYILLIPALYIIISLILTSITVNGNSNNEGRDKSIYLHTNGVHLDIVIPIASLDSALLSGIKHNRTDKYLSFGWGDENFYINTPTWGDLTLSNALKAMFLKSSTLMHVTRYKQQRSNWVEVKTTHLELLKLNTYLQNTFSTNHDGLKIILEHKGYSAIDDFYQSKGSYSCLNTCNSWANNGFRESGLKSCLWTPFDFGLMDKYE